MRAGSQVAGSQVESMRSGDSTSPTAVVLVLALGRSTIVGPERNGPSGFSTHALSYPHTSRSGKDLNIANPVAIPRAIDQVAIDKALQRLSAISQQGSRRDDEQPASVPNRPADEPAAAGGLTRVEGATVVVSLETGKLPDVR